MNPFAKRIEELTDAEINEINQRSQRSVSEEDLQELEKKLGILLPLDYREFLRDYGGTWLALNSCPLAAIYHLYDGTWGRASVNVFYTVDELVRNAKGKS